VLRSWEERAEGVAPDPEEACRDHLRALDTWRQLPYADPGLPGPQDWPGARPAEVFGLLHARLRDARALFVRECA